MKLIRILHAVLAVAILVFCLWAAYYGLNPANPSAFWFLVTITEGILLALTPVLYFE